MQLFTGSSGGLTAGHIGTISNVPLAFFTNSSAPRMTIDTAGLVGIGTTTPAQTLTVAGSARITGALRGANNSAGTNGQILQTTGTGFNWVATSTLGLSSSFSNSAQLAALLSDETGTGSVVFSASPTFTGTVQAAAATLSSTLTLSGTAANIALGSNYLSGDGGDEGIFVDSTGDVGIGTAAPSTKLHILGDGAIVRSTFTSTTSSTQIQVKNDSTVTLDMRTYGSAAAGSLLGITRGNRTFLYANDSDLGIGTADANFVSFGTNNAERMRIDSAGLVGIGTTTPSQELTVA
jgi:hypothetical protein